MAEIRLSGIYKEYDLHTYGLEDVSLTFADGSLATIVGMPGSGKSTLLNLIGGIVDITSGDLYFGGERFNDVEPRRRDVCLMREGEGPGGTAADSITYGLRLRGMPRGETERRLRLAAELLGLTDVLGTKVKKLSTLMRRRVSLARGAARMPAVFLLDDPYFELEGGDRLALAEDIRRVHAETGLTVIVASSFGDDAFLAGGDVIVLKSGRVVQRGGERELTESPADMFVASFVGPDPCVFVRDGDCVTGVRRSDILPDLDGDRECTVVSSDGKNVYVRLEPDSPVVALPFDGNAEEGSALRLRFARTLRFDPETGALLCGKVK